jgi:pimeloyl-ACP methyl ester carboxylesterase
MDLNMRISTTEVQAAGMAWRVHRAGEPRPGQPPLVLLHGGGVDSALLSYGAALEPLAAGGEVIAPDLPGYGGTTRPAPTDPCTSEWYVESVLRLLDAMELPEVDLGGLSLGGGIAIGTALDQPARVRRLLLFAPYGLTRHIPTKRTALFLMRHKRINDWATQAAFASRSLTKASLRWLIRNKDRLTNEIVDAVLAEAKSKGAGDAWWAFQQSEIGSTGLRTCYLDQLPSLDAPTLILAGARDKLVPAADCRRAGELIANARLEVLEGCGHWIGRDQPERFVELVNEFRTAAERETA